MYNHIVVHGRLTADPELKQTQSGVSVCNFTVAVDRSYKNGEEKQTDFLTTLVGRRLPVTKTAKFTLWLQVTDSVTFAHTAKTICL